MARTAPTRKFLFERSFDDPSRLYMPGERRRSEIEAEAAAEAAAQQQREMEEKQSREANTPAPEPVAKPEFTQAQLDAAKEEGYIQGHSAALEEAATAREHYVADAMNLIAQGLAGLGTQQAAANKDLAFLAMRMVYGVAQRLLPKYAQAHAVDNIEAFVREVLPIAVGEPRLIVRSHPMIAEDLDGRLKEVFARAAFQGTYSVVQDYEVQPGDCRLEWDGGGADRNEARIWAEIREVISGSYGAIDLDHLDQATDQLAVQSPPEGPPADAGAADSGASGAPAVDDSASGGAS